MVTQVGSDGDGTNGWVSDAQLAAQIAVLNAAFAPLQVTYVAAGVNRIKGQPQWWCVPGHWCNGQVMLVACEHTDRTATAMHGRCQNQRLYLQL